MHGVFHLVPLHGTASEKRRYWAHRTPVFNEETHVSTAMEDRLAKAREQVQELHEKIDAARAKSRETMRGEFAALGTRARELSATIRELAAQDRADARKDISDAADALHEAAEHARTAASEQHDKAKQAGQAALGKVHDAVKKLSASIAARRSAAGGKISANV
ncbi:MAG TPA: hypothetical protein VK665_06810 [Candidatus Elarobacter sp.]|nr:hypothetical protein [Candidatus Elarobacter sp.]